MPVVFPGSSIAFTTGTACLCCGTAVLGLECRTRGGYANNCGTGEFDGFCSTPPKFYKTSTYSGEIDFCLYDACGGTVVGVWKVTWSGALVYTPTSTDCGTPSDTFAEDWFGNSATTCADAATTPQSSTSFCGTYTDIASGTQKYIRGDTICCDNGPGSRSTVATGYLLQELTDEDTEADAIARLLAGAGGTWSAWGPGSGGICALSRYELRTCGGFPPSPPSPTFQYQEAQFKYAATGLLPSTGYTLTLDVYQSVFGMGSYSNIGTISAGFTTDGSGNKTITGNVPITEGYDTYVSNPVVT